MFAGTQRKIERMIIRFLTDNNLVGLNARYSLLAGRMESPRGTSFAALEGRVEGQRDALIQARKGSLQRDKELHAGLVEQRNAIVALSDCQVTTGQYFGEQLGSLAGVMELLFGFNPLDEAAVEAFTKEKRFTDIYNNDTPTEVRLLNQRATIIKQEEAMQRKDATIRDLQDQLAKVRGLVEPTYTNARGQTFRLKDMPTPYLMNILGLLHERNLDNGPGAHGSGEATSIRAELRERIQLLDVKAGFGAPSYQDCIRVGFTYPFDPESYE